MADRDGKQDRSHDEDDARATRRAIDDDAEPIFAPPTHSRAWTSAMTMTMTTTTASDRR